MEKQKPPKINSPKLEVVPKENKFWAVIMSIIAIFCVGMGWTITNNISTIIFLVAAVVFFNTSLLLWQNKRQIAGTFMSVGSLLWCIAVCFLVSTPIGYIVSILGILFSCYLIKISLA